MLLMTSNTAAEASVRAARPSARRVAVGAQRRALTDDVAEGTPPPMLKGTFLCFQQVPRQ
jgi:hypothetical protein